MQRADNPRFSVRAAFKSESGVVDASDGRYATKAGRETMKAPKTCAEANYWKPPVKSNNKVRTVVPPKQNRRMVEAELIDTTSDDPAGTNRAYWRSKNVVANQPINRPGRRMLLQGQEARKNADDARARIKQAQARSGVVQASNVQQKLQARASQAAANGETSFTMDVPVGAVEDGEEIIVEVDGEEEEVEVVEVKAVVRPTHPKLRQDPNPEERRFRGRQLQVDESTKTNRDYWKSKNVVSQKPAVQKQHKVSGSAQHEIPQPNLRVNPHTNIAAVAQPPLPRPSRFAPKNE